MPRSVNTALTDAVAAGNSCAADLWTFIIPLGGTTYRWTTCGRDIVIGGTTWTATAPVIQRGPVRMTSGVETSTLDITLQGAFTIGGLTLAALAAAGSFDDVSITLERIYLPTWETTPTANHKVVLFLGYASEIEPSSSQVKLTGKSVLTRAEETLPRRIAGPMCSWRWGETRCSIVVTDFQATDSINASGTTAQSIVLVTGTSTFIVIGALITFSDGSRRVIQKWTAGTKTAVLDSPLPAIPSGSVTIQRGCDKTFSTCSSVYSNLVHFSGFPWLPRKA